MERKFCIAVIEDDPEYRRVLGNVLNSVGEWRVSAECPDAASALQEIPRDKPDLILLDIQLPGINGIDAIPRLKKECGKTPIVMLTVEDRPDQIVRALESGASGYILKGGSAAEIRESVAEFLAGGAFMSPAVARRLISWFNNRQKKSLPTPHSLTERQAEILQLAAKGKQQGEISFILGISLHTVKNHFRNIYEKLGVDSLREALIQIKNGRSLLE